MTFPPSLFAFSLVTLISASGSGDYELVTVPPAPEPICAKSFATCQEAQKAIHTFGLFRELGIIFSMCKPHPNCFPPDTLVIKGYNDK